jgi:hypothetical protein
MQSRCGDRAVTTLAAETDRCKEAGTLGAFLRRERI